MNPERPFAPACERNREPIHAGLRDWLRPQCRVLEIGSGTGQHCAYFCAEEPGWHWQCSDLPENLPGIARWLEGLPATRCPAPLPLDVSHGPWPATRYDAVFSANTLHIMPWSAVEDLFAGLPRVLADRAQLIIYGPFNYAGEYTSASNAQFDAWLRQSAPHQGIRDIEAVRELARQAGLALEEDRAMPANNRLLRFCSDPPRGHS